MDDDINSSDIEFDQPVNNKGAKKRGQASIAAIIANAASDRISSKRTVVTLEFGRGAPPTMKNQQLWVQRFNTFREVTLKKDIHVQFTGDDLLRFLDCIIGKIKPGYGGKPAPGKGVVKQALDALSAYGTFTYPPSSGYKLTGHDASRLQTWLDDAVKAGRLTTGIWEKRVWLSFMTVSRMGKAWLAHHLKNGTWSWDITIAKLLSIVLICSIGMRNGDVARSTEYTGTEYMQYRHFELKLGGDGEPRFENLRALVTVEFPKDAKNKRNVEFQFPLRPLNDPEHLHMCPIALILIHAFRHGLLAATSLQEALENAAAAPDSRVEWLYPNRPIIAAFTNSPTKVMDLDKAAGTPQPLSSIKQMGIISNILSRVYVHALRSGAARDIAHLPPPADGAGFASMQVAQSLRHSNNSFQTGVTAKYIREPSREVYNDRAERKYESIWGPKFTETSGQDIVKRRLTGPEIDEWLRRNPPENLESSSDVVHLKHPRKHAATAIRKERHQDFIKTSKPENKKEKGGAPLSQRSASEINAGSSTSKKQQQQQQPEAPKSGGGGRISNSNAALEEEEEEEAEELTLPSVDDTSMIDPRLLDETALATMEIDAADLQALEKQVFGPGAEPDTSTDGDDLAATQSLLDDLDGTADHSHDTTSQHLLRHHVAVDFILEYSKINVVSKANFAREWARYQSGTSFEESVGKLSVMGHSRDPPTPMEHQCRRTIGCPFKAWRLDSVMRHEFRCSAEANAAPRENSQKPFKCTRGACDAAFDSKEGLKKHIQGIHDFEPKPCPHGCTPEKMYTSVGSLSNHLTRFHDNSGRFPMQCLYPECSTPTEFKNIESYSNHLTKLHRLNTAEKRRPYLPEHREVEKRKRVWDSPLCPVKDCNSKQKFRVKSLLSRHLVAAHGYEKKAADEMAEGTGYVDKLVTSRRGMPKSVQDKNGDGDNVDDESADEDEEVHVARKRARKV